jgi:hypothetical protein
MEIPSVSSPVSPVREETKSSYKILNKQVTEKRTQELANNILHSFCDPGTGCDGGGGSCGYDEPLRLK